MNWISSVRIPSGNPAPSIRTGEYCFGTPHLNLLKRPTILLSSMPGKLAPESGSNAASSTPSTGNPQAKIMLHRYPPNSIYSLSPLGMKTYGQRYWRTRWYLQHSPQQGEYRFNCPIRGNVLLMMPYFSLDPVPFADRRGVLYPPCIRSTRSRSLLG